MWKREFSECGKSKGKGVRRVFRQEDKKSLPYLISHIEKSRSWHLERSGRPPETKTCTDLRATVCFFWGRNTCVNPDHLSVKDTSPAVMASFQYQIFQGFSGSLVTYVLVAEVLNACFHNQWDISQSIGFFRFTQVACQLLKYFVALRRAPPSQSRFLCHRRVHRDALLEPEASRGDFLRLAALAQVPLFGAQRVVLCPQVPALLSECRQCPLRLCCPWVPGSSPGPAVTAAAAV